MLVVGLTGSIGMGKSTVAGWMSARGVPVCDSDAVVHELYGPSGAAVASIGRLVPDAVGSFGIDRTVLSAALKDEPGLFAKIESIVHPLVRARQREFLDTAAASGTPIAVLDIPLLFETGGEARCDVTVVVHAPESVQRGRVLARPGMTVERFELIRTRQMPSEEKLRYADFVVDTSVSLAESEATVARLLDALKERRGTVYQRLWSRADSA